LLMEQQLSSCTRGTCAHGTMQRPAADATQHSTDTHDPLCFCGRNGTPGVGKLQSRTQATTAHLRPPPPYTLLCLLSPCVPTRSQHTVHPPVRLPLRAPGAERAHTRLARGARLPEGRASTTSTQLSAVPAGSPLMVTCRSCTDTGLGRVPTGPGPLQSTAQKYPTYL
jgi:hypothetical protein